MNKKIKLDPNKLEFDGKGFKVIIKNEDEFWNRLKKIQNKIGNDLKLFKDKKKRVIK